MEFNKLLDEQLVKDLTTIKDLMQNQFASFTESQKTLSLKGQIQGVMANLDPLECIRVMIEEFKLLTGILSSDKGADERLSKAIDCHIKNICQLYKDYNQSLDNQAEDFKENEAILNATIITDTNMADAFAILERSKSLRDWLAHPNMKTKSQEALDLKKEFKQRVALLFEFCRKKYEEIYTLTTGDKLTYNPSGFLMNQDNKFHKDIPKLDDLGLTNKSLPETKSDEKLAENKTNDESSNSLSALASAYDVASTPKKKKSKLE